MQITRIITVLVILGAVFSLTAMPTLAQGTPGSASCSSSVTCPSWAPLCVNGICQPPNPNPVAVSPIATSFQSPTGTQNFAGFMCNVVNFASGQLLPPIAVLMALVAGFLFLTSGGDPRRADTAKKAFFFTLVGAAVLLLAPGIVALISNIIGGFSVAPLSCSGSVVASTLVDALVRLVNWFAWFVAVTSVVMGLYGGVLYMTARGDAQRVVQASRVVSFTIIGIAVSVVAFSIIALVKQFLG